MHFVSKVFSITHNYWRNHRSCEIRKALKVELVLQSRYLSYHAGTIKHIFAGAIKHICWYY